MTPPRKRVRRLWLSGIVATVFYGGWSFFANQLVSNDLQLVIRSALVQGLYSGGVTLLFTWLLETTYAKVGTRHFSFAFVVPLVCLPHSPSEHAHYIRQSFNRVLSDAANWFKGTCWPAVFVAPLLPLLIQSTLVVGVNVVNATPNLWLTVAPSIFFSGLYGYLYTLALYKKRNQE
ncbi:hypothetical protein DRW07_14715 [Alteromonas sediminis]|uniref:Uncharacterized protein n=1 Tax=Alteromonas sediminis TaxID=2259342 RepID=A0A3N5XZ89_9ALTE|nr:hypothetical protein [Alteromonas sediminis]RPJ66050.1 hypothetical protein DRW07_14715 [Alteromonas sediminis]